MQPAGISAAGWRRVTPGLTSLVGDPSSYTSTRIPLREIQLSGSTRSGWSDGRPRPTSGTHPRFHEAGGQTPGSGFSPGLCARSISWLAVQVSCQVFHTLPRAAPLGPERLGMVGSQLAYQAERHGHHRRCPGPTQPTDSPLGHGAAHWKSILAIRDGPGSDSRGWGGAKVVEARCAIQWASWIVRRAFP